MAGPVSTNQLLGIVLIIVGALLLLGPLNLAFLVWVAAVAAIVIGIVILVQKGPAQRTFGILLIVAGVLVLAFDQLLANIAGTLNLVLGIVLVVAGILKLMGKW